jgi:hypothetical protein
MFFHFVVLCWVFQVTNLSIVFNDLGIECKDFRRFKKFNPSTYPRHSTLLVLYSICFCWAFFFYVIVTFLSPSLQSFTCIIIFFLTLLFGRSESAFYVMLYMEHWNGKVMKDFSHVCVSFSFYLLDYPFSFCSLYICCVIIFSSSR